MSPLTKAIFLHNFVFLSGSITVEHNEHVVFSLYVIPQFTVQSNKTM